MSAPVETQSSGSGSPLPSVDRSWTQSEWQAWYLDVRAQVLSLRCGLEMLEQQLPQPLAGSYTPLKTAMGNPASRPSCLGEKGHHSEEFLKSQGGSAGPGPDPGPGAGLCHPTAPPPPATSLSPGSPWAWRAHSTREVTEVTEVTETVVTEIVEVTRYPGGRQPTVTRTVTMLSESAGPLAPVPQWAALPPSEPPEPPAALQSWLDDMEELQTGQGPPAAEVKVASAQLQEQKLLKRLLEEGRPRMERLLQDTQEQPSEGDGGKENETLTKLQKQWDQLTQKAEARWRLLEQLVPAARSFQAARDTFVAWLGPVERLLAQLWWEEPGTGPLQGALEQVQGVCEEVRQKASDMEIVRETGQRLLKLVVGEEAQLVREQLEELRVRLLLAGQSGAHIRLRLEQTLEAATRLQSSGEPPPPAAWLGRLEQAWAAAEPGEQEDRDQLQKVVGEELSRLDALGQRVEELNGVTLEASALQAQLGQHKLLAAELLQKQELRTRLLGLLVAGIPSLCPSEEKEQLQAELELLRSRAQEVQQNSTAGVLCRERALSLLAQFAEAQGELTPWLEEAQDIVAHLNPHAAAGSPEACREQQELLQHLREAIAEHRPLVGKLQRVFVQLKDLNPAQSTPFQEAWQAAEEELGALRGRVDSVAATLGQTVPQYTQLSERLARLAEQLEQLARRVENVGTVRADAQRIREQLREQSLLLSELEPVGAALDTARVRAQELGAGVTGTLDESPEAGLGPRVLQAEANRLWERWSGMQAAAQERANWLRVVLALAEQFWQGLADLATSLADTQHLVLHMEDAGPEPEGIRSRLSAMQALREEVDGLQSELDALGALGLELLSACGDGDRPEVTRSMDELYASWHSLSRVWTERHRHLEEQLQDALSYQEAMQRLLAWLEGAELRLGQDFRVGGTLELAKQQLEELKDFKRELYQSRVEVESLRHRPAPGGPEDPSPPPLLGDFRLRWDHLEQETGSRQQQLEAALLGLGQLQPQLEELVQWLGHTAEQLQGAPAVVSLDLPSCEIELAKLQVLQNDVLSRAQTVQSVSEAAQGLLQAGLGEAEAGFRAALQTLDQRWEAVQGESQSRQLQLENSRAQLQDVELGMAELLQWLEQVDLGLVLIKPSWGPPDPPQERLARHLELCRELEQKQPEYEGLRQRLGRLLPPPPLSGPRPPPRPVGTEHSLRLLEQTWERVAARAQERKVWLSEGLALTTEFHQRLQALLRWGARVEEHLGSLPPPSLVLDTVLTQLQEHKVLAQEVAVQGEKLGALEVVAGRLRGFSPEQDCALIQSLVLSTQERLGRAIQRIGDRGTALEEARRRAKQFTESRQLLLDWLDEVEPSLMLPGDMALSQEEIKEQLSQHKEFQRELRGKRPVFEATLRGGRALREGALFPDDAAPLDLLLAELRGRWEGICSLALDRQHALEEALLFSGRFADALPALMDWLYQAEPQLAEEGPVAGDRDLVNRLLDQHKVFQKELGRRAGCVRLLRRSIRELTQASSSADSQWLHRQMEELGQRWELVCHLSLARQARLEEALRQAEEFHKLIQGFLKHLSEAEKSLKLGPFPEEEGAAEDYQKQLQELLQSLQCQQLELDCITSLGEEILSSCHPDGIIPIRSCLSNITNRFHEVLGWAQQQGQRVADQLATMAAEREELARLLDWIASAEEALSLRDQEPLPEDIQMLADLSAQHMEFTEELSRKQQEVETAMKSCKRRLEPSPQTPPQPPPRKRGIGKPPPVPLVPLLELQPQSLLGAQLLQRWQQLWLRTLDRQYRLQAAIQHLEEQAAFAHFDFGGWRKRYLQWISHRKSRLLDVFRAIDRDQDGRITHQEFIDSVLASSFPTSLLELNAVASIFDTNGDGVIDYGEFVSALHPSRDPRGRGPDAEHIQDEVRRQVSQCQCTRRFQVEQISANRYRFGESQQLRLVRILRSCLMVRVGGGWIALDEFLVKNDPCRVKERTNLKINEKFLTPDGNPDPPHKTLSRSCSASNLSLSSSASAPNSPQARKSVLRRTRSGDRAPRPFSTTQLPSSSDNKPRAAIDVSVESKPIRVPVGTGQVTDPESTEKALEATQQVPEESKQMPEKAKEQETEEIQLAAKTEQTLESKARAPENTERAGGKEAEGTLKGTELEMEKEAQQGLEETTQVPETEWALEGTGQVLEEAQQKEIKQEIEAEWAPEDTKQEPGGREWTLEEAEKDPKGRLKALEERENLQEKKTEQAPKGAEWVPEWKERAPEERKKGSQEEIEGKEALEQSLEEIERTKQASEGTEWAARQPEGTSEGTEWTTGELERAVESTEWATGESERAVEGIEWATGESEREVEGIEWAPGKTEKAPEGTERVPGQTEQELEGKELVLEQRKSEPEESKQGLEDMGIKPEQS